MQRHMGIRKFSLHCCFLAAALAAGFLASGALAADQAGVAGGVVGKVSVSEGERPAPAVVTSGMPMLMRDRVQTEAAGRMQVLLVDETVFTVGPDSDLVIDEFVYDPAAGTGRLTANFTKGVLRYVSGKVAAAGSENVTIKTPTATIGVRGTALFLISVPGATDGSQFAGLLGPGDKNNGNLKAGGMTVRSGDTSTDVLRAGFGVFLTPGQDVGAAVQTPPEIVQALASNLTGAVPSESESGEDGGEDSSSSDSGSSDSGEGDADMAVGDADEASGQDTADAGIDAGDVAAVATALDDAGEGSGLAAADGAGNSSSDLVREVARAGIAGGGLETPSTEGALPSGVPIEDLVVLTWSNISDLDLHLTGPNASGPGRFHVYYADDGVFAAFPFALLDDDNGASPGENSGEIIGISNYVLGATTPYRVTVFNYSDRDDDSSTRLSDPAHNLRLRTIEDGMLSRGPGGTTVVGGIAGHDVRPPAGVVGHTWTVLDYNPNTDVVTIINRIDNAHDDGFGVTID